MISNNFKSLIQFTLFSSVFILKGQESISPPNFIFYLADDQDQLDYGAYGNPKVHTPAVDQLAKEGMKFTNFYTLDYYRFLYYKYFYNYFNHRNICYRIHVL